MQTNILEYLERIAEREPNKPAVFGDGQMLTFQQLLATARRIGSCLLSHGITGAPVVVLMRQQPESVAAFLGAIYAGCYYVPLHGEIPRQELREVLEKLDPGVLLCDGSREQLARSLPFRGLVIAYDRAVSYGVDREGLWGVRQRQRDSDPIYMAFTFGATGPVKGILGHHRTVIDYAGAFCQAMGIEETAVCGSRMPLEFDAYIKELIPTLKYKAAAQPVPFSNLE